MSTAVPPAPRASPPVVAAGALLWRATAPGDVELLLVHRPRYDDWSLPKGKLHEGEPAPVAAVREVAEETGYDIALGPYVGPQHYLVEGTRPKTVHYWAGEAGGETSFRPGREVDEVVWVAPAKARELLTWPRDRDLVDRSPAPRPTTPLLLLRHAEAVGKEGWSRPDAERPLAPSGEQVARRLASTLRAWEPLQGLTSPARRCADSLLPWARAAGMPLRPDPRLAEEADAGDVAAAARDLLDGAVAGRRAVACTHRPTLPWLLAELGRHGDVPEARHAMPAGGFLVLHVADRSIVATERYHEGGGVGPLPAAG